MPNVKGYYFKAIRIKDTATPIDNETKFAWDDDDYEEVKVWHEYTEEELKELEERENYSYNQELINSLPDAVADLSDSVSSNSIDISDIADAIAELSEIISTLTQKE